ncbi:MAG: hypothetical protein ACRDF9_02310, partial [Candidatus Limnocylindria bacterium]
MRSRAARRLPAVARRATLVVLAMFLLQITGQIQGPASLDAPPALRFLGPGGADAVGPGPVDVRGFVRVVDGDTLDVWMRGQRVAVGLVGV